MKRRVWFGMLGLFSQAKRLDWDKIIGNLGPFTGMTFLLRNPWTQHPDEYFDAQEFDGVGGPGRFLAEQNSSWFRQLRVVSRKLFEAGKGLRIKFFDQYLNNKGRPWDIHPMTHGMYAPLDHKGLYDSWVNGQGFKYIEWDDDPEDDMNPINFRAVNNAGTVHWKYIKRVCRVIARSIAAVPGADFGYAPFNETYVQFVNGKPSQAQSKGDRHELATLIRREFEARGLFKGPKFRIYNNYGVRGATVAQAEAAYQKTYKGTIGKPLFSSAIEIHSVGEQGFGWQYYEDLFGGLNRVLLSTDAVMKADGNKANRDLFESPAPDIELKPEEKNWPMFKWDPYNMQKNVDFLLPALIDAIT